MMTHAGISVELVNCDCLQMVQPRSDMKTLKNGFNMCSSQNYIDKVCAGVAWSDMTQQFVHVPHKNYKPERKIFKTLI